MLMINDQNLSSRQSSSGQSQPRPANVGRSALSQRSLLLCGGGTGGHVYPALAVASVLPERMRARLERSQPVAGGGSAPAVKASPSAQLPNAAGAVQVQAAVPGAAVEPSYERGYLADGWQLLYVGSYGGMEEGLVARESTLPFCPITAAAVRGRGPAELGRNSLLIVRGIREARALIRQERPAAILGTGGYVCIPLFVAARQLGVPTMIYLPDIVPGLAVKVLARIANQVACSFEPSLSYLPRGKTVVTGYPVRQELFAVDRAASRAVFGIADDLPVLFVYGGSRGARSVNRAIEALLPDLLGLAHIIHVCGREGDETWLREAADRLPAELQQRYHLFPYLHGTMVQAFGAADVAIARSGASTLAELPAAQLPAVLVPYPYVHQDENADYLVARGAAVKVADSAMLGSGAPVDGPLFREVRRLLTDQVARAEMARQSAALARPDAAARLADTLLDLAMRQRPVR